MTFYKAVDIANRSARDYNIKCGVTPIRRKWYVFKLGTSAEVRKRFMPRKEGQGNAYT